MSRLYRIIVIVLTLFSVSAAHGQHVGIKTNLLYWGTTTPNLGLEIGLGPKATLDLQGSYNPWFFGDKTENRKMQHWKASAEGRMWLYEKFNGHFFGLGGQFTSFNAGGMPFGDKFYSSRYEGYSITAGFSYGYMWYLSPHWSMEATIGFGYSYMNYDRYDCIKCGDFYEHRVKHYVGPTKLGFSFIYLFKSKK